MKIWLLEVNQSPSLMTDSPLDYSVKKNLICDTLHMLNLSQKRKLYEITKKNIKPIKNTHKSKLTKSKLLKSSKLTKTKYNKT